MKKTLLLVSSIMMMAACSQDVELYDPARVQQEARESFPVKDIDSTQTWEMVGYCKANVVVNENMGEECTIKFYNGNPLSKTEKAYLLAQTSVQGGQQVDAQFDVPEALKLIYVVKVTKEGYSSMVPTVIEDGKISVSFGASAAALAKTRAAVVTRTVAGVWTPEEKYKNISSVPTDAIDLSTVANQWNDVKANANYTVSNAVNSINLGKPLNLFITGNDVKWNSFYINGASNIIIMPGAKLTAPNNWSYSNSECHIYNFGTLELTGCNWSNVKVYNATTIHSTGVMDINNNTEFINDGTINCESTLKLSNGISVLVNDGTINTIDFGTEGSSKFYNEDTGVVTVSGTTTLNSNNCTWNNDGKYTTKFMNLAASSKNWTNACKLYVTEKMTIATSSANFNMNGGSYAEIKDLYMDMSRINMGSEAYLYVTNEAKFKFNSYNQYWTDGSNGIYGIGEKPALVRMNKVVADDEKQRGTITYGGNLKVACDNHFALGHDDGVDHLASANIMVVDGATMSNEGECDIHLEETACRPGYKPTAQPTPTPSEPQEYFYAFEDMTVGNSDYDFNDVLLKVTAPVDNKVKVTIVAIGAVYNLGVYLGEDKKIFDEVHTDMGVEQGKMVNTGAGANINQVDEKTFEIDVPEGFTIKKDGDFCIYVIQANKFVHIPAFTKDFKPGDAPYAIRIPKSEWAWPTERTSIRIAYPDFAVWAQDATKDTDWYNNPSQEKGVIYNASADYSNN